MSERCAYADCVRALYAKGYCNAHYRRALKGADMDAPFLLTGQDEARFWNRVERTEGCWLWRGTVMKIGYGAIRFGGRNRTAHRVSYELNVGPIPEGKQIDHACRNRLCVNPDHLRPLTDGENKQNLSANRSSNTSGVRGVSWYEPRGKWMAKATVRGKQHYLGYFTSLEEADKAVSAFRRIHMPYSLMDKEREDA
jgi:hypothetical protein